MLIQRILTVLVAAPFLIGAIIAPWPWVFKAVVALCVLFGLLEFFFIVHTSKEERFFAIVLGVVHNLYLLFCPEADRFALLELTAVLLSVFIFHCLKPKENMEEIAQRISLTLLGILYISTLGAFVGLTRELPYGIFWVFGLLAMTWLNDTAAYFIGHRFGKHLMAEKISPKKTWEGFFGGFLGSFAGFFLFWRLLDNPLTLGQGLILTLLVGVIGPIGDLCESMIKRSFGVKDSGNIIPGHGGMLDRIDALLFTAPMVYFFATFI